MNRVETQEKYGRYLSKPGLFYDAYVQIRLNPTDAGPYETYKRGLEPANLSLLHRIGGIFRKSIVPQFVDKYVELLGLEFGPLVEHMQDCDLRAIEGVEEASRVIDVDTINLPGVCRRDDEDHLLLNPTFDGQLLERLHSCYMRRFYVIDRECFEKESELKGLNTQFKEAQKAQYSLKTEQRQYSLEMLYDIYTELLSYRKDFEEAQRCGKSELLGYLSCSSSVNRGGTSKTVVSEWVSRNYQLIVQIYTFLEIMQQDSPIEQCPRLFDDVNMKEWEKQIVAKFKERVAKIIKHKDAYSSLQKLAKDVPDIPSHLKLQDIVLGRMEEIKASPKSVATTRIQTQDLTPNVDRRFDLGDQIDALEQEVLFRQKMVIRKLNACKVELQQKSGSKDKSLNRLYSIVLSICEIEFQSDYAKNCVKETQLSKINELYERCVAEFGTSKLMKVIGRTRRLCFELNQCVTPELEVLKDELKELNATLAAEGISDKDDFDGLLELLKKTSPTAAEG